jgi:hypothetical protein
MFNIDGDLQNRPKIRFSTISRLKPDRRLSYVVKNLDCFYYLRSPACRTDIMSRFYILQPERFEFLDTGYYEMCYKD